VILSASDIYGLLTRDPILGTLTTVYIVETRPVFSNQNGVHIYIKKYPLLYEFEATWNIWIVDYDEEPLDIVIEQIKSLLPQFKIVENGAIIKAVTTELRTDGTEAEPLPPGPTVAEVVSDQVNLKFEELRQSIEDRMLLVGPGRPGRNGEDGLDGKDGRDGKDGVDGRDLDATEVELGDLANVLVDDAKRGQVLAYDGQDWVPEYVTKRHSYGSGGLTDAEVTIIEGLLETGEPMGHSNRSESTMSFDDTTRTFTIAPVGDMFKVWVRSKRFIIDSPRQVQIPDITDLYYIYFDENGDLLYKTQFFTFSSDGLTSYIYWDADENKASYFGEERHGIVLDWQTHEYLHRTRGASIANGFDISNYTLAGTGTLESDVQFDVSNGTFFDEDIKIDITHSATPVTNSFQQILQGPAELPVLYRLGDVWKFDAATEIPVKSGLNHTYYNPITAGAGALVEADSGKHLNYYVMATNNLKAPVVSLMGQQQYVNIASAEAESFSDLLLEDFPSKEFRFLYKLVLRTSNYTNSANAIIEKIQDIRYYSDIPSALIT
jgi:hypothetical protein